MAPLLPIGSSSADLSRVDSADPVPHSCVTLWNAMSAFENCKPSLGKAWNTVKQAQFDMTATDDQHLAAYHWASERSPRALIVLAHGMGEHAQRYRPVLAPLIETGIDVYALDHRGHGATATDAKQLGDLGSNGFAALVADLVTLTGIAKKDNPGLPVILLGHSMGSMAAQLFTVQHSDLIDGLALSGTGAVDQLAVAAR